jgi:hypothetical protein
LFSTPQPQPYSEFVLNTTARVFSRRQGALKLVPFFIVSARAAIINMENLTKVYEYGQERIEC